MNELARTAENSGSLIYRVGDLLIDTGRQRVTRDGNVIALPKLSYDLLIALVRAAPNLLSIDGLMEEVWPKLVMLNDREIDTLTWVARGKTSAQIAEILDLSKRTIDFHLDNGSSSCATLWEMILAIPDTWKA